MRNRLRNLALVILTLTSVVAILIAPTPLLAATTTIVGEGATVDQGLLTGLSKACMDFGDCSMCDLVTVGNNVMKLILGIVGSLALLAFAWGGFYLMFKGADVKAFSKGKEIIQYAVIGLILVFFAYNIVNLGLNILISTSTDTKSFSGDKQTGLAGVAQLFKNNWSSICAQASDKAAEQK